MKKRTLGTIAGIMAGIAGLVAGVSPAIRNYTEKARVEAQDIYIEQPTLNPVVQKVGDKVIQKVSDSDYFKSVSHPQSGRVYYNFPWDQNERVSNYVNTQGLANKIGRTPDATILVTEKKVAPDQWVFDNLLLRGSDLTPELIADFQSKAPWIFEAAQNKTPYTLQTIRDNSGKVRKLVYHLVNGETRTLEDTDGNFIADRKY